MRAKAFRQEEVNSDIMELALVHASESHWNMESFPLLFLLPVPSGAYLSPAQPDPRPNRRLTYVGRTTHLLQLHKEVGLDWLLQEKNI